MRVFQNRCFPDRVPVDLAVVDVRDRARGCAVDPVRAASRRGSPGSRSPAVSMSPAATVDVATSKRQREGREEQPNTAECAARTGRGRAARRSATRVAGVDLVPAGEDRDAEAVGQRVGADQVFQGAATTSASTAKAASDLHGRPRRHGRDSQSAKTTKSKGGSAARSRPSRCGANRAAKKPTCSVTSTTTARRDGDSARAPGSRSRPRKASISRKTSAANGATAVEKARNAKWSYVSRSAGADADTSPPTVTAYAPKTPGERHARLRRPTTASDQTGQNARSFDRSRASTASSEDRGDERRRRTRPPGRASAPPLRSARARTAGREAWRSRRRGRSRAAPAPRAGRTAPRSSRSPE